MPYSHFSTEEFVTDTYFIRWVKTPDEETHAFWNAWISKHPHQKESIQKARQIVLLLNIEAKKPPEGKFLEVWDRISQATLQESAEPVRMARNSNQRYWFMKVAAAALVFCAGVYFYAQYRKSSPVTISTGYGESRTLFLPDSTKVTLNGNSTLRYIKRDFEQKLRQVNLQGQAFFSVTHTSDHQNFKVYTSELQVEVLGTRFDVNSRRGKTKVVLEEGKVRLDAPGKTNAQPGVVMRPGEFAEATQSTQNIQVLKVDAQSYMAWRNNRLEFTAMTLQDIAQILEDSYGYQVRFGRDELRQRRFTGSGSSEDIPALVDKLARIFDMDATLNGKEIILE
jgi:ferric-dicitrate binding protein FerR (iron transport regulator)